MIIFEISTVVDFTAQKFFSDSCNLAIRFKIYELTLPPQATHLGPDDEGGGGWHWHEYWQNVSWCGRALTETRVR